MRDDVVAPLVVVVLAMGAGTALALWLRLGRSRTITVAVAVGILAALVSSEFIVSGAGDWWQRHPSTGATLTGILLLALTVLVVETAVKRTVTAAEEQRWRPAGQVAASQILARLAAPIRDFQDEVMWVMGEGVEFLMSKSPRDDPGERARILADALTPRDDPGERARILADALSDIVLRAAPVLSATERLHEIYAHALDVARIANDLSLAIPAWWREDSEDASLPMWASESARLAWWRVLASRGSDSLRRPRPSRRQRGNSFELPLRWTRGSRHGARRRPRRTQMLSATTSRSTVRPALPRRLSYRCDRGARAQTYRTGARPPLAHTRIEKRRLRCRSCSAGARIGAKGPAFRGPCGSRAPGPWSSLVRPDLLR